MVRSATHLQRHTPLNELTVAKVVKTIKITLKYEGLNFNSGNYLFTTDTK